MSPGQRSSVEALQCSKGRGWSCSQQQESGFRLWLQAMRWWPHLPHPIVVLLLEVVGLGQAVPQLCPVPRWHTGVFNPPGAAPSPLCPLQTEHRSAPARRCAGKQPVLGGLQSPRVATALLQDQVAPGGRGILLAARRAGISELPPFCGRHGPRGGPPLLTCASTDTNSKELVCSHPHSPGQGCKVGGTASGP